MGWIDLGGARSAGQDTAGPQPAARLRELAGLFLRLGTIAFGGPAAHIALMEDEVVRRRKWLTREDFLDFMGATNLMPGPNSTELAIHVGQARAGPVGLLVAGTCFILPAALIVTGLAWAYVRFGSVPAAEGVLYGVRPVVIVVVLQALWGLARTALKDLVLMVLGIGAVTGAALGVHELVLLAATGAAAAATRWASGRPGSAAGLLPATESFVQLREAPGPLSPATAIGLSAGTAAATVPFGLWPLFAVFLKIGAVLFGSGYVLLAFLRADLVERFGWLTERQLLDAVAVGQVTPGPVFTTATFIGYLLGGGSGAVVATVGIFLPAFVFVALSGRVLRHVRRSPTARAVLDGVNVASLALMGVVTVQLTRMALVDLLTVGVALASGIALFRFRTNPAWLVMMGALMGVAATWNR